MHKRHLICAKIVNEGGKQEEIKEGMRYGDQGKIGSGAAL